MRVAQRYQTIIHITRALALLTVSHTPALQQRDVMAVNVGDKTTDATVRLHLLEKRAVIHHHVLRDCT
jgi:hypothetical protein